ncbi:MULTISPECIES: site-specific integrase [Burkholderia cepacia complex]|nr:MULTISPECIES: site-specific integrase [Burkholderia cepacia complex]
MSLPFLFLQDGELSYLALAWVRNKMLIEGSGTSTLAKAVSAIGRFYDYYQLERNGAPLAADQLRLVLAEFYEARRFGRASLGWDAVKVATAAADVRAVSDFTEWCTNNFGHAPVNPKERVLVEQLNLREQKTIEMKRTSRREWDMLHHLEPASDEAQGIVTRRAFDPARGNRNKAFTDNKHFPPDTVWEVILKTPSLRDKLYLLLLFFGGVRISEPMHLFASDISIQPDGTARVVLGHPQDGSYQWIGRDRKKKVGNRATFLQEKYGLTPRNLLAEKHPLHAGWKGMMADDKKRSESVVHWLREDAGRLFARLHAEYIRTVRSKLPDTHPYYFVNEKEGDSHGQPLKLSNMSKAFNRAAERVSLSPSMAGVNPHGARHFYGFYCASVLRLPIETTQRLMHHASVMSTEIYYALSAEAVRKELLAAQERQALEAPDLLAAPTALSLPA